jgi:hypothetical protein
MTWTVADLHGRVVALAEQIAALEQTDTSPHGLVDPLCTLERWAEKHKHPEPESRSCLDRIESHAAYNEENYLSMMGWYEAWGQSNHHERQETAQRRIEESPLSVTRKATDTIKVEESTGGPADGYEATFDPRTGRVESVEYYFQDWFDGARMDLDEREFPGTWRYIGYWADAAAEGAISMEDE